MGQAGLMKALQAALAAIRAEEVELLLADLIAIESHSEAHGQEAGLAKYILQWFQHRGIEAWLEEAMPGRFNAMAKLEGARSGASLLLNGHLDTVPPYGMDKPFEAVKRDGKIFGRGSVDMKGALAAMMMAMDAIHRSGGMRGGTIYFAGTAGEETFSPGAWHLGRSGFAADYAIVGEPTELQVGIAHKGVAWYVAEFDGVTAHGSVPDRGVNAIYKAAHWIAHLEESYIPQLGRKSHPLLGSPTLNIGTIVGGTRPVIVPGSCTVGFERRLIPGETAESALLELQDTLREVRERKANVDGTVRIDDNFHGVPHGPLETPPDSALAQSLLAAVREECPGGGRGPEQPTGLQFWTDGALLQLCCSETVVCGPGSIARAHSDEEYIEADQLLAAVRIYIRAALTLCEPGGRMMVGTGGEE